MTIPKPGTPEFWERWFSQIPTESTLRYVWERFKHWIKDEPWFRRVERAKDQRKAELQRLERR